jgi:tyrosine-protein kinase Etk/Wzc
VDTKELMEQSETYWESKTDKHDAPSSTVLDLLAVLTKYRRFLSWFILGTTLAVTAYALVAPRWYRSTASVFPAEKADLFGGLEGIASLAKSFSPGRALSALGSNPETDRYLAILKSGTVLNAVIQKFDLVHVYDITAYPGEKTMKELLSNVDFVVESEGNLTISVYDRDPQRAADMANFFVDELNRANTGIQVQNARANREFIEQRYTKNLADIAAAEDSLTAFQKRYGIIAMPEQTQASIKAAAEITAQLALKEVQVGVLRRTQSVDNPAVAAMSIEVEELRHKLSQMNSGAGVAAGDLNVFVPFRKVPELGAEYVRRFRNVEIQYKILQFITPLYEQAKVEERRETPSVVVLDKAGPAERKAKPKVSFYALMGLVLSTLVAFLVVFIREMIARLDAAQPGRFTSMVSTWRSDWFGLRLRRR